MPFFEICKCMDSHVNGVALLVRAMSGPAMLRSLKQSANRSWQGPKMNVLLW